MARKQRLRKHLGLPSVFAICTGAMFSSGFFLLPGLAAEEVGPVMPLMYVLAGLAVLPATLCVAELASGIPRAGGPYLFLSRAMGPAAATIGGIGTWVQLLFKSAFSFVGVGYYLSLVADVPIVPVAVGLVAIFTALNLVGAKQTAVVEIGMVAVLLLLLTYFVVAGGAELTAESRALGERFSPLLPFGAGGVLAGMALVAVSYSGIGQVASVAEEVKDPARTMVRGMLGALAVATALYAAGTGLMVALIAPDVLRGDLRPVATAAEQLGALRLPIWIIVIAALAAFMSTGNAGILSAARYPLAMARDGFVWARFAKLDASGTPRIAVLATGAATAALILLLDVEGIAKLASAFFLLVVGALCAAVIVLRESRLDEYTPGFRVPLYPWVPAAGMAVSAILIVASGWEAWLFIVGVTVAGSAWCRLHVRERSGAGMGASAQLAARLAHRLLPDATVTLEPPTAGAAEADDVVGRAMVCDLGDGVGLDEAVEQAAQMLAERVGAETGELATSLKRALHDSGQPAGPAVIASALVDAIEQPEMVLVRAPGGITGPAGRTVHALLLLVGDPGSPPPLEPIERRLRAAVARPGFAAAWRRAESPRALRALLRRHPRTLAFAVEEGSPTAALAGAPLRAADLPGGCLVALVRREGDTIVPDGETEIAVGDEVTMVGEVEALEEVAERFGLALRSR